MDDQNRSAENAQTCPDCRALVSDLQEHQRWHGRLVKNLANAVEAELKRSAAGIG